MKSILIWLSLWTVTSAAAPRAILNQFIDDTALSAATKRGVYAILNDTDGFATRVADVVRIEARKFNDAHARELTKFLRPHGLRLGLSLTQVAR